MNFATWLAAKRLEAHQLNPDGFNEQEYAACMVGHMAERVTGFLKNLRRASQPNYTRLGITDPEGQN